ncbi:hypothetical protein FEM48_Zijuj12G0030600 [Ziziphus jujuba var. spinosa]|uniref:Uncharacterized protein n=1 Tax=Ziziphus jujuba var. spinosa TaxID=714518 RepID=A0A978UAU3_ZIZJJ|nr:hypothetical protein FEM48_Zijuj12G0030600 [Ziziphus jujuba var. spinosa]
MGKLSLGRMLDCLCLSSGSSSCFCMNSVEHQDEFEKRPLIASEKSQLLRLKDVVSGNQTLAFQLKPKFFFHLLEIDYFSLTYKTGVTSYKVDLESKMVVVIGDILPFEVLESVAKVKNAELWNPPKTTHTIY